VEKGFDPILGARPLRRSIQRLLEDRLAEEFLKGKFNEKDTVVVSLKEGELIFTSKTKTKPVK
jgi:ATP-dependent Clp protease ATP-binding subunit ClpC